MCGSFSPKPSTYAQQPVVTKAEQPLYSTAPEPEKPPKLVDEIKSNKKSSATKARKRGIGVFRTDDLGISNREKAGKGLQI